MYLRCKKRKKDGKEHRYWSVVENRRVSGGKTVQKHLLYLGEINDSQRKAWRKSIEVFSEEEDQKQQLCLFPSDREEVLDDDAVVRVIVGSMSLHRPRQWGACWLACELYRQLKLDAFWSERLEDSRKGTDWTKVLQTLVCYRLIEPGSEWRLHRHWFDNSAMADLLDGDFSLVQKNTLYRCHDKLLEHKEALFSHLRERWENLFNPDFEVLLYDLTSTYFESDPDYEADAPGLKRYGYSRDKRSDCLQVVIALIVTTEGLPLAYEVMPGDTADKTTLKAFLEKIERQYGKCKRTWVMDRGIPTEEVLEQMRASDPPVQYLVGTPRGRLNKLEASFLDKNWELVREGIEVKLLEEDDELYVLTQSTSRRGKERAMRQKRLRQLIKRLRAIQALKTPLKRDTLLLKLGEAKKEATQRIWKLIDINIPEAKDNPDARNFTFKLNWKNFRNRLRHEGRYLLRSNLTDQTPETLWRYYMQLSQVEEAFKDIKGDLSIRPVYHQKDSRIEAHIFIAFLAYCLHITLKLRLGPSAPGLTPRSVLEKMASIQMLDVHLPTTDGRELRMSRHTQPLPEHQMILEKLKLKLPEQPKPRIHAKS
jgi:transposase